MFNQNHSSKRNAIKRMEAYNILPQIRDVLLPFSEENIKEVNRILTAFSEIGELPKTLSAAKLDHEFLHDDARLFDAFKSVYLVSLFLTHPDTIAIIKDRLITRYPFDMKNALFIRLSLAAQIPDSYLSLLCFYFERDYDDEYGTERKTPYSKHPNIKC